MVKPLCTTLLLPADLVYVITFYRRAIKEHLLYDAAIIEISAGLKGDLRELNDVLSTVPHTRQVEDLCETHAIRDYLFEVFTAKVRSFSRRRKADLKGAYLQLRNILKLTDGTATPLLGFEAETKTYEELFAQLGQTKNQKALTTLGLYALYQELESTHKDCMARYRVLSSDNAMDFLMLRKVKLTVAQHVNELLSAIETLDKHDEAGLEKKLVRQINEVTSTILNFISDRIPKASEYDTE